MAIRNGLRFALLAIVVAAGALLSVDPAMAQESGNFLYELKIGGLYHDPGDLWSGFRREPRSLDINAEALFGPHVAVFGGILRPALGATINTRGGTSKGYADARWEIEGPAGLFLGLGLGAAIHDGNITPVDPARKALGSRVLFHIPAEIGWRWDVHNSISFYFEHMSNGYTQDYNEGLDTLGVRYGYRF